MLWSCDDFVIQQLFALHPKLEQPLEILRFFDLWGPTIGTVSGEEWRSHRAAVTAGLGTGINNTVWLETQQQMADLVTFWIGKKDGVVPIIRSWTSRLALHIICSGFFDIKLQWNETEEATPPAGHRLTFDQALFKLLERLALIHMVPRAILSNFPYKPFREASIAFAEVTKYFEELQARALENVEDVAHKKNKTLLGSLSLHRYKLGKLTDNQNPLSFRLQTLT